MRVGIRTALSVGAVAAVLTGVGCGDSASEAPVTTSPATTVTANSESVPEEVPAQKSIDISVANGEVIGGGRISVAAGEEVILSVTSDVADEVHVHGIDKRVDVAAGETATVNFTADIAGIFEIELEERRLKLADLVVR